MQKRLTLRKTKAKEGWTMKTRNVLLSYWRWPPVLRLFVSASALIVLFGALMRFIEPETFRTVFDGVWWAIVTAATIGYGDIVPKTIAGKTAALGLSSLAPASSPLILLPSPPRLPPGKLPLQAASSRIQGAAMQ
ncbi:Cyclic nucleotide-gated potassium channel [Geobacillus sp. BCO2]|nr:Cyclic nucleotide-gated potassium channel [Geobacillus sp. BCO2]